MVIRKGIKNIIFFCIAALVIFTVSALATKNLDLADYPKPFIKGEVLNSIIIVGENAKTGDMIGAIDIATSLGPPFESGVIVLDTQIDNIKEQNIIIVGGPCVNTAAAEIMGWPLKCDQDFEPGKAKIKLFDNGNNVALLVAGYAVDDTTIACRLLANYDDYDITGNEIEVAGTILDGFIIEMIK
ncbi:MAG: hypothetical protein KKA61_02135 [Nanoarchaeota archaeon]|nr:hypothetical protein [Nanoarchaeota archaeon]MBU4493143.1 hypothetical protein [Nanoarchaeota archaeon]